MDPRPGGSAESSFLKDGLLDPFYVVPGTNRYPLRQVLKSEARNRYLGRRYDLLQKDVVRSIIRAVDLLPGGDGTMVDDSTVDDRVVSYSEYKDVRKWLGAVGKELLPTTLFMKLYQLHPEGRVSLSVIKSYIIRKAFIEQMRINLLSFDSVGQGFLNENDLDCYFHELLDYMPFFDGIKPNFRVFYVCHATRWLMFHLDPNGIGQVKISDVICSKFMDMLFEMQVTYDKNTLDLVTGNWFTLKYASSVYFKYIELDLDHNGMLSMDELRRFNNRNLTHIFIATLFESTLTYANELDYRGYITLLLAFDNSETIPGIRFFFKLLDVTNDGYICDWDINYFLKDVLAEVRPILTYEPRPEDVAAEIYDMVLNNNSHQRRFSLMDLIRCKKGHIVIKILIDTQSFLDFESNGTG